MDSEGVTLEAVASGASVEVDSTVATAVEVTDNTVEVTKIQETTVVVEKGSDSNTASVVEGTDAKGNDNKAQKGQKVTGGAKRKRGKKPAAAAAVPLPATGDAKNRVEVDQKEGEADKNDGEVDKKVTGTDKNEDQVDEKETEVGAVASNGGETGGVNEEKTPSKKGKRKRAKKQALEAAAKENAGTPVAAKKDAGLIFMCNAKTKADCFKHRIFGLPEGKKDVVAKVSKGMTLFLYDFDLKLLYGIYRAASPGGYNLEPKAFNSAFPAQVRFAVVDDCTPLASEKFKEAIKANYYGRNKFNVQLSEDQVKSLCKLFRLGKKGSKLKSEAGHGKVETPGSKKQSKRRGSENDYGTKSDMKRRRIVKPVQRPRPAYVTHIRSRGRHDAYERGAYPAPQYTRVVQEPAYAPEPIYAPEPAYAPKPVYAPEPAYAPKPVYAPEPAYAPKPVYAPEPAYAPKPVYAPEPAYAPSYAYDRPTRYDYYRREEPLPEIPSYMLPDSRPDLGLRYALQRETAAAPTHYPGISTLTAIYAPSAGRRY